MVKNSNIGRGVHYTLDQALIIINKVIDRNSGIRFSDKDLLKSAATGSPRVLCLVEEKIPLLRQKIFWNEDEEGVFSEYIPTGIDCFTGFFYLDEANGCRGLDYLKSLIYGYESDGITRINRRQQEYTRTFYQDTDYDGYHWTDELDLFIADLSAFDMDCGYAHVAFGSSEFNPEYVPIGSIRPTLDSLYIFEDDLKIFLMGLRGEQEEQLAAFNDDELGFDGKRGSATIIDNDETPKSEKKPLVRMKKDAKNMNVNSPKVRKMLEAMSEYQCDDGYSIDFGELWEQSEDKFGYVDRQRASARKAYYKRFEKIEHPTTANVE